MENRVWPNPCALRTPTVGNFTLPYVDGQVLGCQGPLRGDGPCTHPDNGWIGFLAGPWAPGKSG